MNVPIEVAKHKKNLAIARKRCMDAKSAVDAASIAIDALLQRITNARTRTRGLGKLSSTVRTALDAAREAVATCKTDSEQARGLHEEQRASGAEWGRRAAMVEEAGSLELAEEARALQREHEQMATLLQAQNDEWQVTREALRPIVSVLETRVEGTRTLEENSVAVDFDEVARTIGALKTELAKA